LKNFSGRLPLKWFEDDLNIIQSREIDKKEEKNESVVIEELKEQLIVEEKFEKGSTIGGNTKKKLIIEEEKELNIEENPKEESIIKEHLETESIGQTNLKEDTKKIQENTSFNENVGKEDIKIKKTITNLKNKSDINFEECSSCSEDSESDNEITSSKPLTNSLVKEMDQKSLQKFYTKMKKQRPGQDLIDRILKGRYPKLNQIFDEPTRAIPLPRKSGTINVTFSERAFPTPARESAFVEEQEVRVFSIINSMINIFLLRIYEN